MHSREHGIYTSFNLNRQESDIRQIGLSPDTIPAILSGTNSGLSLGLFYDFPISKKVSAVLFGGYTYNKGLISNTTDGYLFYEGNDTLTTINSTLKSDISSIDFQPQIRVKVIDNLLLIGGISVGYRLSNKYTIKQESSVDNIYFQDGSSIKTTDFIGQSGLIRATFLVGLGYQIYFDKYKRYSLTPEIVLDYGYTQLDRNFSMDISSLKFGISFSINPDVKYPEKIEIEQPIAPKIENEEIAYTDTLKIVEQNNNTQKTIAKNNTFPPKIKLSILYRCNNDDEKIKNINLKQTISSNVIPILNYVFFDKNSSNIPGRYKLLTKKERKNFDVKELLNLTTLNKYHHILNIIGYRLLNNQDAIITLTGCNSGDDEGKNLLLSQARTDAIKSYLVNVWDIEDFRIICKSRNLPKKFSNPDNSLSNEENRRVEINSNKKDILGLLITNDTLVSPVESSYIIKIENGEFNNSQWQLIISNNKKEIRVFSGVGKIPKEIEWHPIEDEINSLDNAYPLRFYLKYRERKGKYLSSTKEIKINVEKAIKRNPKEEKKYYIENYNLILFDFDSYSLTDEHYSIINYIILKIKKNSRFVVEGHADITGKADYNKKLSTARAKVVYNTIIKRKRNLKGSYEGQGYAEIYNNSYPEGRFYSRTVIVRVITEKKEQP